MGLRSCLYECRVIHRRLTPKTHRFAYRIFMFSLDLAELPEVARRVRGFGLNFGRLYSFRDADHLAPDDRPVRLKLDEYLATQGVTLPPGARVQLITLPRVLGYVFNPVSFFYCFDAEDRPVCTVVEVGNTFREMKLFFMPAPLPAGDFHLRARKDFYVSPFSTLDTEFDFRLALPGGKLKVLIDDYDQGKRSLVTSLTGTRAELSTRTLLAFTLKYPLLTLRVIFLIHWQALLLWLKRTPFFQKTAKPEQQKDVLRPHRSLLTKT